MTLTGNCIKDNRVVDTATVVIDDPELSFHDQLEQGLLQLCQILRLTTPIWMKKNTVQLSAIAAAIFDRDQFIDADDMRIDKFEIRLERR